MPRTYVESEDELAALRVKLYRLEDKYFRTVWLNNRIEWFRRAPLMRILWWIALVVGGLLSMIKTLFRMPTHSNKYDPIFLEAKARKLAGCNDEFDDKFHRVALECVIKNSVLHGELQHFVAIVPFASVLEKKLRVQRLLKMCTTPRPPAIFIVGLPRTGSTILHQLCSLDKRGRSIRAWEFRMPFECSDAPPGQQDRIAKVQKQLDGFYKIAPAIKAVHYVRSLDADECVQGFYDCALPDWYLWGAVDAPEAFNWYVNADMTPQYENYKRFLRVVLEMNPSTEGHNARYLWLKTPHHTFKLPELARVFPEAKFVWLHRDPAESVGSCSSMNEAILDATCPYFVNPKVLGERTMARLSACAKKGMEDRRKLEAQGRVFIDVPYTDLKRDLIGTMKSMYRGLGLDDAFPAEFLDALNHHVEGSSHQAKGHRYSLAHFGLTKDRIHREFREYIREHL
jgi:hypothetical protein